MLNIEQVEIKSPTLDRRNFLRKMIGLGGVGLALAALFREKPESALAERYAEDIPYTPGYGWVQSFPWWPANPWRTGEHPDATGTQPGGVLDKADLVYERLYGVRIADVYGTSTREHMLAVQQADLANGDQGDGLCFDSALAAYLCRGIGEGTKVLEVEFSKREVMQAATVHFGGRYRQYINPHDIIDLRIRVEAGQIVIADYSDIPGEEWNGLITQVGSDGKLKITIHQKWASEDGLFTRDDKYARDLRQVAAVDPNYLDPKYGGLVTLIDPVVAGLILGIKRLVG